MEQYIGDNGRIIESDYKLEDFGEDILPKLEKMPKQDLIIKHYSQYHPELIDLSMTGCTVMSGINAYATLCNRDFTIAEIRDIYKFAIERGFKPGGPWSRSEGWITVKKWLDKNDPKYSSLIFTVNIFSEEWKKYIEKLGAVGISILVDSAYWKDAKDNLRIEGNDYGLTTGHATVLQIMDNYKCVDSIPQKIGPNLTQIPMLYEFGDIKKLEQLRASKNLRLDCHIIILDSWLKETDEKEIKRLQDFKLALEQAIEANSKMRHLTTQEEEKLERNRQNNYNRGKLAVVNSLLGVK